MKLQRLREQVLEANLELVRRGLVLYTFGNASGISREEGLVVIKPSGVPYDQLKPEQIKEFNVTKDDNFNTYYPGHRIAMPPPLSDGKVTYVDGTKSTLDQQVRDVVQFLAWASEPHLEERNRTGIRVILFLLALAGLMYAVKRQVWADQH